jgi:hypothetical protein
MDYVLKLLTIIGISSLFILAFNSATKANSVHHNKGVETFNVLMNDLQQTRSIIIDVYNPSEEKFIKYCDYKAYIGLAVYADKKNGKTLDWALTALNSAYDAREKDDRVPRFVFLEHQRMARTVFRHPELDHKQLFSRFYKECFELGF